MTVHVSELFELDKLNRYVEDKLVYARRHDTLPLTVYKYTEMATYQNIWDEVTMRTRGLVLHDDGTVVARSFDKFFNYSQLERLDLSVDVEEDGFIMNKMDGSLGIVFKFEGEWHVATQGSFGSDQAIHATNLFRDRYADTEINDDVTLLVEIIYPWNRIVANYGEMDDLVLLAGMSHQGAWIHPDEVDYAGPKVPMTRGSIMDALNSPDPGDLTEGFVIRTDSGDMVKLKFPSYIAAHHARFSITELSVWRNLSDGSFEENMLVIPDEFHEEVRALETLIVSRFNELDATVNELGSSVPVTDSRKDRAIWVNENVSGSLRGLVMSRFVAERNIDDAIWKEIRPNGS